MADCYEFSLRAHNSEDGNRATERPNCSEPVPLKKGPFSLYAGIFPGRLLGSVALRDSGATPAPAAPPARARSSLWIESYLGRHGPVQQWHFSCDPAGHATPSPARPQPLLLL